MTPEITNIGRYQINRELGRGGMATVYDAYDPRFGRNVAIKVLPRALLHDPQFRVRFEREAKTVALLEHPAIVPVYDFGEDDGQPYIVMQMMVGGSLADRLEKGPIAPEEAAKILTRLAQALDVAHEKGIIHRDLKPGNVLFDQYGNAFLSDFGIARLKESGGATLTGSQIIGTPAYMSPEQVQGEKSIDGRSDIYSLGIILFLMLSNQMPFQADTPAKVMLAHILEPAPSILTLRSDLPPGIDTVLDRALAKDPDDRYPTATQMAEEFTEAVRSGQTTTAAIPAAFNPTIQRAPATRLSTPKPGTIPGRPADVQPVPQPGAPASPARGLPRWAWFALAGAAALALLGGIGAAMGGFALFGDSTPLAAVTTLPPPSATSSPTAQPPSPTFTLPVVLAETPTPPPTDPPTPAPTDTPTPELSPTPGIPIIGGADKLAFVMDRDIWVMNLDGTDLTQLTTDGALKSDLRWTPDGQLLMYISGTCIKAVTLEGIGSNIACFRFIQTLEGFAVSPDMTKFAMSLDNQMYIVPYDLEALNPGTDLNRNNIIQQATQLCEFYAPYKRNFVREMQWSNDGQRMALRILGVGTGPLTGINIDVISIIDVGDSCRQPEVIDNFPIGRFTIPEFDQRPEFTDWNWDGEDLFTITSHSPLRTGFGDLYLYNGFRFQGAKLNPISETCCYREARWSPDGQYLLFVYQEFAIDSKTEIYYVFFSDISAEIQPTPLPLPDFPNPREFPQPALRPAATP